MSLLTDEEIDALWLPDGITKPQMIVRRAVVRAAEKAILAKLAGAELPEPVARTMRFIGNDDYARKHSYCARTYDELPKGMYSDTWQDLEPLFTAAQLTAWGNTRFAQGAAAQLAEKPSGYLSQYNLVMLQQGYPQTIVMLEGAKRDVPLYTRRQAND